MNTMNMNNARNGILGILVVGGCIFLCGESEKSIVFVSYEDSKDKKLRLLGINRLKLGKLKRQKMEKAQYTSQIRT